MAYVIPNSTVILLRNISLTPTYENTVDYDNADSQYNDMIAHQLARWDRCTYVGKNKQQGVIRLESTNGLLMQQATYMMFKNTSYENKWFYAFVTDVTWVNNVTWEVSFILDVLQTYYFDFTYEKCFIERQHSVTDKVGDNIIDEGLETGEYIANYVDEITDYAETESVVCARLDIDGNEVTGESDILQTFEVDGIYIGSCIYRIQHLGTEDKFFNNASNAPDSVLDYYNIPTAFAGDVGQIKGKPPILTKTVEKPHISTGKLYKYTPRNNKLFTYPYCYLRATDLSGNTINYRYELFNTSNCTFDYTCTRLPNPEGYIYPNNYDNISKNYDEGLSINDFPRGAYPVDTYKAWLAQTANARTLQMLGASGSAIAGFAGILGGAYAGAGSTLSGSVSNFVSTSGADYSMLGSLGASGMAGLPNNPAMGIGGIGAVLGLMAQKEDHKVNSQRAVGNKSTSAIAMLGKHIIQLQSMCIQQNYAEAIDSFFDKYGYKQNIIAVPNIKARPHWNYIKTVGCDVKASLPAQLVGQINSIHDSGVTFWKNLDSIGDYSLDNKPV
jgi:hypothetical protein